MKHVDTTITFSRRCN